jgi:hypothetical protein
MRFINGTLVIGPNLGLLFFLQETIDPNTTKHIINGTIIFFIQSFFKSDKKYLMASKIFYK